MANSAKLLPASAAARIIFDSVLGADAASIDTGAGLVPAGTKLLEAFLSVRTARAAASDAFAIKLNNDATAANYLTRFAFFSGGSGQSLQTAFGGWYVECPSGTGSGSGQLYGSSRLTIPDPLGPKNIAGIISAAYGDGTNWGRDIIFGHWGGGNVVDRISIASVNGANLRAGSRLTVIGYS